MRVLAAAFLVIPLAGCGETPPCERDVEAFVMSQTFIERQLRSPGTAEFPSITASGVNVKPIPMGENCAFRVMTYVDAQNGFGATLRQNFMVELQPAAPGSDSWKLNGITPF